MAKDKKKDKAAKADTKGNGKKADAKEEKAAAPEFKFGVEDIAEKLDIKPASVRVQLRNKGIEKAGKSYGWNTKAELDEVISQLKAKDDGGKEEKSSKKSKKGDGDEKAAKKDKKKKSKD